MVISFMNNYNSVGFITKYKIKRWYTYSKVLCRIQDYNICDICLQKHGKKYLAISMHNISHEKYASVYQVKHTGLYIKRKRRAGFKFYEHLVDHKRGKFVYMNK